MQMRRLGLRIPGLMKRTQRGRWMRLTCRRPQCPLCWVMWRFHSTPLPSTMLRIQRSTPEMLAFLVQQHEAQILKQYWHLWS